MAALTGAHSSPHAVEAYAARFSLLCGFLCLAACSPQSAPEVHRCAGFGEGFACAEMAGPVCARVDTGVRCIQPPCPSSDLRMFAGACEACDNSAVDLVFNGPCESLQELLNSTGETAP